MVEFIGIIHTIRKFQGSFTQKLIHRKNRKYLLLSDFLLDKITTPKKLKVESFYPLDYPKFNLKITKTPTPTASSTQATLERMEFISRWSARKVSLRPSGRHLIGNEKRFGRMVWTIKP